MRDPRSLRYSVAVFVCGLVLLVAGAGAGYVLHEAMLADAVRRIAEQGSGQALLIDVLRALPALCIGAGVAALVIAIVDSRRQRVRVRVSEPAQRHRIVKMHVPSRRPERRQVLLRQRPLPEDGE
jgi:hypothetical protein